MKLSKKYTNLKFWECESAQNFGIKVKAWYYENV